MTATPLTRSETRRPRPCDNILVVKTDVVVIRAYANEIDSDEVGILVSHPATWMPGEMTCVVCETERVPRGHTTAILDDAGADAWRQYCPKSRMGFVFVCPACATAAVDAARASGEWDEIQGIRK